MTAATLDTPYSRIGEAGVSALVNTFYDLIEQDSAFQRLRATHAEDLGPVRQGLARFLVGWLGGPRDWFTSGQCMMSLHRPIAINAEVAGQWAAAMRQAIACQESLDPALAEQLADALGKIAQAMINRPN